MEPAMIVGLVSVFIIGGSLGALATLIFTSRDPTLRVLRPGETIIQEQTLFDMVLHLPQAMKMKLMREKDVPTALQKAIKKEFSET